MISQIQLKSFKKHEDSQFDFSGGLNSITGANAQGKTSLLRGVLFALLGASAAGNKEHLATRGSSGDTKVSLDIHIPGHEFVRIERTLKGAKIFSADGTLIANGTTPSIKLIEEAYGMSSADLQLLMYSRQGESQALLAMGAAALQKTVERLAKTDLVDSVLTNIGRDIAELEGQLGALPEGVDIHGLAQRLELLLKEMTAQQKSVADARKSVESIFEETNELSRRHQEAHQAEVLRTGWMNQLASTETQVNSLSADLSRYSSELAELPGDVDDRLTAAKQAHSASKDRAAMLETKVMMVTRSESEIGRLGSEIESLKEQVIQSNEVKVEIDKVEIEVQKLREQRTQAISEQATALQVVEQARAALDSSVCQECKRPFSDEELREAQGRYEEAANRLEGSRQKVMQVETPLAQAEATLTSLKKRFFPGSTESLAKAEASLAREQETRDTYLADKESFASVADVSKAAEREAECSRVYYSSVLELTTVQAKRTAAETMVQEAARKLEQAKVAHADIKARLDSAAPSEDYAAITLSLQQKQQQLQVFRDIESKAGTALAQVLAERERVSKELEDAQSMKTRRAEVEGSLSLRKRLQAWLRKSRSDLMLELWDGLFHFASHLLASTTGGQITRVYRLDGEITVDEAGIAVPVSELSGFQRSLVGLALRIGMSRVFYGGDLPLLLDEPTADASEENAARVAGMLQGLRSQVIIVSHRLGDSANAENFIQL